MPELLFDKTIFGPIKSRRLGNSLGINLLPLDHKFCNFDCVYCECGWTKHYTAAGEQLPQAFHITEQLINELIELNSRGTHIDSITFAGNGEPTLHPKFDQIMEDVVLARDLLLPEAKISVLTNATMMHKESVKQALQLADHSIFKLDAGTEELFQRINRPTGGIHLERIKRHLMELKGELSVQTLFFRGNHEGESIDNTTVEELEAWKRHILDLQPKLVMLYSLDRETPAQDLEVVPKDELETIAEILNKEGIETLVT